MSPVLRGSEVIPSVTSVVEGGGKEFGQVAPLSPSLIIVSPQATEPAMAVVTRGGSPGQVASAPSSPLTATEPPMAAVPREGAQGRWPRLLLLLWRRRSR